jgi:hypothetical protein
MRKIASGWMLPARGGHADRDFEAELESHIRIHTDDGVSEGSAKNRHGHSC